MTLGRGLVCGVALAAIVGCKDAPAPEAEAREAEAAAEAEAEATPAAADDGWMAFSSDEGRFGARFPSAPQSEVMPTATAVGNVDQKMFSTSEGDVFYAASFADYPADVMKESDTAAVLDGARDGAVSNVNGKLIREKQIAIDGHPGRDIRIQAEAEGITMGMDARIYLVDNRLYQMIVVRPGAAGDDATTARFLDSFYLAK